jgi:hypothetical protein
MDPDHGGVMIFLRIYLGVNIDKPFCLWVYHYMKMAAFWDTAPCSLVDVDRCFRGAYCSHHQGNPEDIIFTPVAVKT